MKQKLALLALPLVALLSCGTNDSTTTTTTTPTATTSSSSTSASNKKVLTADVVDGQQIVVLMAGDDMKFNAKEVQVKANMPIELTLKHTGKMPLKAMGHNVVILKPEAVVPDFANEANAAKDSDYIPATQKDLIVAHTKMLGGGESDVITFTFDKPGTYPFLCSFPGHSGIMKGKFIVE